MPPLPAPVGDVSRHRTEDLPDELGLARCGRPGDVASLTVLDFPGTAVKVAQDGTLPAP